MIRKRFFHSLLCFYSILFLMLLSTTLIVTPSICWGGCGCSTTLTVNVSPDEGGDARVNGRMQSIASRNYSIASGDQVKLEALALEGYIFDHWGGALGGSVNPKTFTFQDTTTIIAYFVLKTEDVQYIDLTNAKNLMDANKDIIVIDVSAVSDFNISHMLCAKNFPWNVPVQSLERINGLMPYKNNEILVYDKYGTNSGDAAEHLTKQQYFKSVYCMTDGLDDWIGSGYETFISGNYPGGDTNVCTCIPPMAFAGADKAANEKTSVTLNGQGWDPDGGAVTYLWTQAQGPNVLLSNQNAAQPTFIAPDLTSVNTELVFHLTVTDNEGEKDSDSVSVNLAWINQSPTADAGPDQSVLPGAIVTLNGSGSTDPDDANSLKFSWSVGQVYGVAAPILSNPSMMQPTFTAPEQNGWIIYSLTVTDNGGLTSSDTVMISIQQESANKVPNAVAEADKPTTISGETVTLDGSKSFDTDGTIEDYSWTQTDKTGIPVALSSTSAATPTFAAPNVDDATTLIFSLIVTDDGGQPSPASTVSVVIKPIIINQMPNAVAEADKPTVISGETVTLDGSKSSDTDGTITVYSWTQTDTTGIPVTLSNAASATPIFTAPDVSSATTLTFSLIVTDDDGMSSQASTLSVSIKKSSGGGGGGGCFISTSNNL